MNFTGYINWKPARGIRSFGIVVGPIISNTLLSNVLTFETQNTLLRIILLGPKHPVLPTIILNTLLGPKSPLETSEQRKQNPVDMPLK